MSLVRCEGCPLKGGLVGSRGPKDSPFMVIGESPGRQELKDGIPFVGPSWTILEDSLKKACTQLGVPWVEPYITNSFLCFPGTSTKNAETVDAAAGACRGRLLREINAHPRKVLLTLGNGAIRSVTNDFGLKITKERGKLLSLYNDVKGVEHAIASIHPAFILRGGGSHRQFKGDILYATSLLHGGEVKRNPDVSWQILDTPSLLKDLYHHLQRQPEGTLAASDLETGSPPDDPDGPGGFNHIDDSILMAGIAIRPGLVYVIPEELILHPIVRMIYRLHNLKWVWHNGKFDIKFLWSYRIPEARVDHDTMLMSYTLDERKGVHSLEEVSHDWLGAARWKDILDKHKKKGQSYRVIPKPTLYKYAAFDISNTLRLAHTLLPLIEEDPNNSKLYYRTLIPGSAYLATVENKGILVDRTKVQENYDRLHGKAEEFAREIIAAAEPFKALGYAFTDKLCGSPKQLSQLLFDCLKIPTKDRSTGDDVLDSLPAHPVVVSLRNYRKVKKQESTYVKVLMDTYDEKGKLSPAKMASDGAIHTTFNLHGTGTGRLSSSDPINMQNIPRDADIRGQFVARPGRIFIEPDLNQAELRSLAEMSGDKRLCEIYTSNSDKGVHDVMREQMFHNPDDWNEAQVERFRNRFFINASDHDQLIKAIMDEQKMKAKNVNFGIVYGITKYGLAEQLGGTHQEAQKALDTWAETFPEAWDFIKQCMMAPRRGQNLVTVFGNRKRHHVVTNENIHALEKEAANFPHQATASHIMLHGGIEVHQRYRREYDANIVNTVHDSMLIECPNDRDVIIAICEDITRVLQSIPPRWGLKRIPFIADAKLGPRWGRAYMVGYDKWRKQNDAGKK